MAALFTMRCFCVELALALIELIVLALGVFARGLLRPRSDGRCVGSKQWRDG